MAIRHLVFEFVSERTNTLNSIAPRSTGPY